MIAYSEDGQSYKLKIAKDIFEKIKGYKKSIKDYLLDFYIVFYFENTDVMNPEINGKFKIIISNEIIEEIDSDTSYITFDEYINEGTIIDIIPINRVEYEY